MMSRRGRGLVLALATLLAGGRAYAAGEPVAPAPPESYSGPPVPFLEHIHGVWRGVQNCPKAKTVTAMEVSLVTLDAPDKIGGVYHSRNEVRVGDGPLRVGVDAKKRGLHLDLLTLYGAKDSGLDVQLSDSGDRLKEINNSSGCEPVMLARYVDAKAAGPGDGVPVITHISELTASQRQHITISGHGFGTHVPIQGTTLVFAMTIHAPAKDWDAGWAGDAPPAVLTVNIHSWKDTEIQSAGFFTGYGRFFHLNPADRLTVYVWNPGTLAGPAKYDMIVTDYPPDADAAAIAPECKDRARAPDEREKACSALIAEQPGAAVLYRLRGIARLKAGQFDAALADFDKALAIDPKMAAALAGKGLVLAAKQDFKGAIAQGFSPALALDARLTDVFWQRGLAYYALSDIPHALADAEAALAVNGQHVPALLLRGELLVELGRYKDAVQALGAADVIDGTIWQTDYFASLAFVGIGNLDAAQKAMVAACEAQAPKELDACGKVKEIGAKNGGMFDIFNLVIHRSIGFDVGAALAQFHQLEKR